MEKSLKLFCYGILLFFLFLSTSIFASNELIITGAGATFPYPLYARWAKLYEVETGTKINYQSVGSGGGIKQIQAKTVDFGASDKPLSSQELEKSGLVQFPTVIGAVVPIVNIPGIQSGELQLTGELLADIYLGKIKKWNDPAILAINPKLMLPDLSISVVHRADGSGTTFLFTSYLSKVSMEWKERVGTEAAIDWPVGIGGKGNEGVAAYVQRIKGTIGYVEFAYTQKNRLQYIKLKNKSGHFVTPSKDSFEAATENINWKKSSDFGILLMNNEGDKSWPLIGATYILMQKIQTKPAQGKAVLAFFNWAYNHGQLAALQLDYIPLPNDAVELIIDTVWKKQIKDKNGNVIWP